ncbi:hypothetical protein OG203_06235 [Nocardia sp. NBC_01499]|uniref:hypothetical protein n=1 Tax=Nocardia sp. NBC_01499 TaxID=2903597 RepID=UPI00386F7FBE
MRKSIWAVLLISGVLLSACGSSDHDSLGTTSESTAHPTAGSSAQPPTCPTAAAGTAGRYTVSTGKVREQTATLTYDVTLPQLADGDAAVRERFNSAMHGLLSDAVAGRVGTVGDGALPFRCAESSRVTRIGTHVIAGVLITFRNFGGPHPDNQVGTAVINTDTAQPIHLSSVLRDPTQAWGTLAALVPSLIPTTEPELSAPAANSDSFAEWTPSPDGLTVYFQVSHAAGDFHPVLIPWSRIQDLFNPADLAILSS